MKKKRSEAQWRVLFKQHDESGLPANRFCRDNKLCPKYYSLRRKQLLGRVQPSSQKAFVTAQLALATQQSIKLTVGNIAFNIPMTVTPDWLATFAKQLQS